MLKRYTILETEGPVVFLPRVCDPAILGVCIQPHKPKRVVYRQHEALVLLHTTMDISHYPDGNESPIFVLMEDDIPGDHIRAAIDTGFGHPDLRFLHPALDPAILGVCYQPDRAPVIAYDQGKVEEICRVTGCGVCVPDSRHSPVLIRVYGD